MLCVWRTRGELSTFRRVTHAHNKQQAVTHQWVRVRHVDCNTADAHLFLAWLIFFSPNVLLLATATFEAAHTRYECGQQQQQRRVSYFIRLLSKAVDTERTGTHSHRRRRRPVGRPIRTREHSNDDIIHPITPTSRRLRTDQFGTV